MTAFSATVMDHFRHPRHTEALPTPSATGWAGNVQQHRFMKIDIQVTDDVVVAARFGTFGCAAAIAAGSLLCDTVVGHSIRDAQSITSAALLRMLGDLPLHRRYCATLAVDALHDALKKVPA